MWALVTRESFSCGSCWFLPAAQQTSAGGLCDGLYSTLVLSHCSKLISFLPELHEQTPGLFKSKGQWVTHRTCQHQNQGSCCPCQFLGCEYSSPSLGHFVVLVGKQPEEFRGLAGESDNARGWQGRRRNPLVLGGHGDQTAQAVPSHSEVHLR